MSMQYFASFMFSSLIECFLPLGTGIWADRRKKMVHRINSRGHGTFLQAVDPEVVDSAFILVFKLLGRNLRPPFLFVLI